MQAKNHINNSMFKYYDKQLKLLTEAYLKMLQKEERTLTGEYWIIDGQAIFADGDTGDMNHEGYVVQHLASEFLNYFDIYDDEPAPLGEYEEQIKQFFIDEGVIEQWEKSEEEFDNDPAEFMLKYLWKEHKQDFDNNQEKLQEAFFIAYNASQSDAREYGMKYLGWVRVQSNNIQTWTLTPKTMSNISRGIDEAIDQEMGYDEENVNELEFNIEVLANRKMYYNVPYDDISSGKPQRLMQYRSTYEE